MSKKNFRRKRQRFFNSNLTTTVSISLVLFLVGIITSIMIFAHDLSNHVKENINFSVVLNNNISDDNFNYIKKILAQSPYTKEINYISKDEALKELAEELGENPQDLLGYNPLSASFVIKLNANYANTDSLKLIENKVKKMNGVRQIIIHKNLIELVNQNVQHIMFILSGLSLVFLFISIGLVSNTIRLLIYNSRFNINTMYLVGATTWFIKKPFIKQNIFNGFIAAILALALLGGALFYLQQNLLQDFDLLNPLKIGIISAIVLGLSLLLSFFAAIAAVNKYLRLETNELYYQ